MVEAVHSKQFHLITTIFNLIGLLDFQIPQTFKRIAQSSRSKDVHACIHYSGGSWGSIGSWPSSILATDFGPLQRKNKREILENM